MKRENNWNIYKDTEKAISGIEKEWQPEIGMPLINGDEIIISIHDLFRYEEQYSVLKENKYIPFWEYPFLFLPKEAEFISMDENGEWKYFINKPFISKLINKWTVVEIGEHYFEFFRHPDWKNSCYQKPEWIKKLQEAKK